MKENLGNNSNIKVKSKPIVPVYLNQRIVFDIVAMMEDGISTGTKVT